MKEIIVSREQEKHVLEMDVQAYRRMISGEMTGKKHDPSLDSYDGPTMLLKLKPSMDQLERTKPGWLDEMGRWRVRDTPNWVRRT